MRCTRQGKSLEAMFDEDIKNEITKPNAKAKPDAAGRFNPHDRTSEGLQYDGPADERYVSGEERV